MEMSMFPGFSTLEPSKASKPPKASKPRTIHWRVRLNNPKPSPLSTVSMIEGQTMTTWSQPVFSQGKVVYQVEVKRVLKLETSIEPNHGFEHNLSLEFLDSLDDAEFIEMRF